jgi:complement component 1 Q subcomponent-binding protein
MSPAPLAARLLRRTATSSSFPFSALARRGLNCSAPVPLPRRLPAATLSSAGTTARRFLASQSPASSYVSKSSADENLRRVIESEIECVVQSEESTADKVHSSFICLLRCIISNICVISLALFHQSHGQSSSLRAADFIGMGLGICK